MNSLNIIDSVRGEVEDLYEVISNFDSEEGLNSKEAARALMALIVLQEKNVIGALTELVTDRDDQMWVADLEAYFSEKNPLSDIGNKVVDWIIRWLKAGTLARVTSAIIQIPNPLARPYNLISYINRYKQIFKPNHPDNDWEQIERDLESLSPKLSGGYQDGFEHR